MCVGVRRSASLHIVATEREGRDKHPPAEPSATRSNEHLADNSRVQLAAFCSPLESQTLPPECRFGAKYSFPLTKNRWYHDITGNSNHYEHGPCLLTKSAMLSCLWNGDACMAAPLAACRMIDFRLAARDVQILCCEAPPAEFLLVISLAGSSSYFSSSLPFTFWVAQVQEVLVIFVPDS